MQNNFDRVIAYSNNHQYNWNFSHVLSVNHFFSHNHFAVRLSSIFPRNFKTMRQLNLAVLSILWSVCLLYCYCNKNHNVTTSSGTMRTTSNALKLTITDKLVSHAHSNGHKKSIEFQFIQLSAKTLYCSTVPCLCLQIE